MIAAVVLAAGLSERMGKPKLLLPWGDSTVIECVVATLVEAGIEKIVVVTGCRHEQIEARLSAYPVSFAFNPDYHNGEMLTSFQVGLAALDSWIEAVLLVLGDQPQLSPEVIKGLLKEYEKTKNALILPSYQMHRGHPWLIEHSLWPELNALRPPATLRDFLRAHQSEINYLEVDTSTVLADLDTPQDYEREKVRKIRQS